MKIGQFGESFIPVVDGVGRVMKAYSETMVSRGHEVYVITPMYDTGFRGNFPFEIVDYTSMRFSRKMPWRIGFERFDPHFSQRMRMLNLDIVHAHVPLFAGHYALHYAKKHHIPIVASFHTKYYDDILQTTGNQLFASVGARSIASFYSKCDEVWAVSEGSKETLHEYGYKGDVIVMPNGTTKRVLDVSRVSEVFEKYKIRRDIPVLLFVGQLSWKKNLKTTIEACGILKKSGVSFQLVLAGQGPDEEGIRELIKRSDLEDRAILTGHLTDAGALDALYSIAELFVFPSTYDTAGIVIREAAAQHTPSLTVADSCPSEIIDNMKNGLITQNTSEDVAKGIQIYLGLPKEKKTEIRNNAYETIPLSWDGPLMDSVLDRYQNLIGSNNLKYRKSR
ncbi:MAG: glycosyltransferase [Spirochaetales bacterium]